MSDRKQRLIADHELPTCKHNQDFLRGRERPSFDRLLTITKSKFLNDCVAKLCIAGLNATVFIMATIAKMLVILI